MEKRNTLLLTVIAVATLLVAVVGATFAYFASDPNTSATTNATITAEGAASFMAVKGDDLVMTIPAANMLQSNPSQDTAAATSTGGTFTAELAAATNITSGSGVKCSYKVILVWNASAAYTRTTGIDNDLKELTLAASYKNATENDISSASPTVATAETDISKLPTYSNAGVNGVVLSGTNAVEIESRTDAENPQQHVWTITAKYYNLDTKQLHAGETFNADIRAVDVSC